MSPAPTPAPDLTPQLALEYLRELSTDIRSAVVLDPKGKLLAGDEEMGDAARDLFRHAEKATEIHVVTESGDVFAARDGHHAIAVVCGRFALPSLIRYDLRVVLDDLAGKAA